MSEGKPRLHHQTRRGADLALAKKQISRDSHRAVHEGTLTLQEARELGRNAGPSGPAVRVDKDDRTPTKTPCLCGCNELVSRTFKPGHDMRLVTYAKQYVRNERDLSPEQLAYVERSGKLERARARVAEQGRRREEKAEKQRGQKK